MEVSAEHRALLCLVNSRLNQIYGFPVWRDPLPAVDELVSTFLSQNTNDMNRDKAFDAIRARYTSWDEVCEADPDEFMQVIRARVWRTKGPNIQRLRRIRAERGEINLEWRGICRWKRPASGSLSFRGWGEKPCDCFAVSLGMPAFPVDTHIYRVSGRIGLRPQTLDVDKTHQYLEAPRILLITTRCI